MDTTEQLPFPFSLSCIGEGNGNPLRCSCLENPRDGGVWWAAIYGVTQSRIQLKRLSSSSSSSSNISYKVVQYCYYLINNFDYSYWKVTTCNTFIIYEASKDTTKNSNMLTWPNLLKVTQPIYAKIRNELQLIMKPSFH